MEDFDLGIFYWAGIVIACFSSFLILGKQKKKTVDFLLAFWFLIIGIHLVFFVLFRSGGYLKFPYLIGFEIPFPFMHGPMLYLYILSLTGRNTGKKMWILHWVPVLMIYMILLQFLMLPPQDRMAVYQNKGKGYEVLSDVIKFLMILSGILYVGLSLLAVRKYKKEISDQYSNTEKINLNWSYYLITGIAFIWIAVIIRNDILIFSMVVLFILVAAYFGISRVGILDLPLAVDITGEKEADHNVAKYQKNSPGDNIIQAIYEKLVYKMKHEKLYKDPDLNLNHVAQLLDVHPNLLSQTINSLENKNFYDYINRQRIEEFKRIAMLPENQKYTILSLAFESGFNSKTSFNRNFKKYMNCSPREFLKSQNLTLEE
ncbi:AraC-like DNA-binding protein [Chryseobacterium rhizosphaerae]|uniref:AraC-like DNA-binding protein n=1 Tax=Chryseobacterium rhizosphaerae TaxID=395937 RepID=A0AAE4C3V7_9FLAO|nr:MULTISPECIES: helix-turn-helix domain-containing protein [Chryseobacterium]MBL3546855.1 AraC family transcriptional regulator [Chryseobacterium sp. KMC2]MDR6526954.1 AraC-like DNA-binding protein [Chryseobacterium rhizosphaerae]